MSALRELREQVLARQQVPPSIHEPWYVVLFHQRDREMLTLLDALIEKEKDDG